MVPDRWKSSPLGNLCLLITDGKHGDCENEDNSGFYFLSARDINDGNLSYANARQITQRDFIETHNRTKLKSGDVLLCNTGSIGKIARAAEDPRTERTTFQKSVAVIKSDPSISDTNYLYYFLDLHKQELERRATGSSQKNLLLGELKNIKVSYPRELKEQKQIARILSTWDKAIETVEKLIENSKAQKKALMQQLLTGKRRIPGFENEQWLSGKLGEFLKNIFGGGTPSRTVERYWRGTIPWVTVKDLISPVINGAQETITEEGLSESASNLVPAGSVIIATRMAVGKAVVATCDVAINQDLKAIIPVGKLCPRYLHFWLILREQEISRQSGGSTVKGISLGQLKALSIDIPPTLEEQGLIVKRLEQSSSLVLSLEEELRLLRQQKKALMQQLLTGKRRVKVDEA